ncbi:MAG: hypothetical protein HY921_12590 [Elusimicrobia bacterium]|nr:hypothetical protein [Elusimicrobiota bacterium]
MTKSRPPSGSGCLWLFLAALSLAQPALAADPPVPAGTEGGTVKIRPKRGEPGGAELGALLQPDVDTIDTPTTAVLDYGGYAAQSRFFANGGVLQHISFGVFQNLNLGASLNMDGIIGNNSTVRLRAPNLQIKYRFFDGDRQIPSLALGYDGQGHLYNQVDKRYNHRQRGLYFVATQELGLPGLQAHPSFNISDFDSNSIFGALPLSFNIQDRASILVEWDNINNFADSRFNTGLRVYMTPHFHLDFAFRGVGQGGRFNGGDPRGPERVVQLRYSGNF